MFLTTAILLLIFHTATYAVTLAFWNLFEQYYLVLYFLELIPIIYVLSFMGIATLDGIWPGQLAVD